MKKLEKLLALDCETSGLTFQNTDPSLNHQIVSIGLIATNDKFEPIDELYLEIQWNGKSLWDSKAEKIHGFSKEYLELNGVSEEEAVETIALFIDKHFGITSHISCLGHNVAQFDVPFLRSLFNRHDLPVKFSHRHVDSFTLGYAILGAESSDELFNILGFEERATHNSLVDAKYSLKAIRLISKLWKKYADQ